MYDLSHVRLLLVCEDLPRAAELPNNTTVHETDNVGGVDHTIATHLATYYESLPPALVFVKGSTASGYIQSFGDAVATIPYAGPTAICDSAVSPPARVPTNSARRGQSRSTRPKMRATTTTKVSEVDRERRTRPPGPTPGPPPMCRRRPSRPRIMCYGNRPYPLRSEQTVHVWRSQLHAERQQSLLARAASHLD